MMTKTTVLAALTAAKAAPFTPSNRGSGCGRAYVVIAPGETMARMTTRTEEEAKADRAAYRKLVTMVAAACKPLGLTFLRKAYGTGGNAIYLGYDNGTGRELARAEAFAASLKTSGISCYVDPVSD